MRKINLVPYEVDVSEQGKPLTLPFDVKGSIANALYHPDLKLSAKNLLDNDRLVQKIIKEDKFVLLEESEYERVKTAFETIRGFGINDVELVNRVLNAETVEVKEV